MKKRITRKMKRELRHTVNPLEELLIISNLIAKKIYSILLA